MINCFVLFAEFFSAYKLENTSPFCSKHEPDFLSKKSKHEPDSIILSPFRVHHNSLIVF